MEGGACETSSTRRRLVDWILILGTTALFAALAVMAKLPHMEIGTGWAIALTLPCSRYWQRAHSPSGAQPGSDRVAAYSTFTSD
jgi:hypothetical protein